MPKAMLFRFCNRFQFFIVLVFHFFLFHFVHSNTQDLNYDEILKYFRPLKYSESCKDFCSKVDCQPITECNGGMIIKNETYCECCEACVKFLDIGEKCTDIIKGTLALGAQSRCKKGTTCQKGICELNTEDKSCLRHQNITKEHIKTEKYETKIWIPQCDEEGYYTAKQKKITRSVCVDKSGNRIFGSADDLLENTCACSRHIQEKIEKDPVSFYVKPHEHCSSSGSFYILQCIGNLCYCADVNTGDVKSELVRIDFLQNLPCFDTKIHQEDYLKGCEKELQKTRKLTYEFRKKGVTIHGIDRVKCDPDGTFSPIQCLPDRCVCTDKEGVGIGQYAAELKVAYSIRMTCNCARDENSADFHSFSCETYGSYKQFTCFIDKCVCVDEDGESIALKELKKSEKDISEDCKKVIGGLLEYPSEDDDTSFTDFDYSDDPDYPDYLEK